MTERCCKLDWWNSKPHPQYSGVSIIHSNAVFDDGCGSRSWSLGSSSFLIEEVCRKAVSFVGWPTWKLERLYCLRTRLALCSGALVSFCRVAKFQFGTIFRKVCFRYVVSEIADSGIKPEQNPAATSISNQRCFSHPTQISRFQRLRELIHPPS